MIIKMAVNVLQLLSIIPNYKLHLPATTLTTVYGWATACSDGAQLLDLPSGEHDDVGSEIITLI